MAVAPGQSSTPLYAFEQGVGRGNHRDLAAARAQLAVLWARLDGDVEQLEAIERSDPESWKLLLRYATDSPLSIKWYDDRRPELEKKQRQYNLLVMSTVLGVFGLAFMLPFLPLLMVVLQDRLALGESASSGGLVDMAALIGVLVSGTTIALRFSAVGVRFRQQAAVFHKASAALKDQLYGLETEWRHKPLVETIEEGEGGTRLHPELEMAIRRAVGDARAIMDQERDDYFDTLTMDVSALTDGASDVTSLGSSAVFRNYTRQRRALRAQLAEARSDAHAGRSLATSHHDDPNDA
ncbi:hypothetical protein [Paraliomyxa miuraensis]|uniref:hypothetical protein n=1 Tax=Paraliomyxa miuraensis TaxID=376150 RepID=UPI002250D8F4|nr:hypothetical protein [Paraliomyxa miuraensis]MCX4240563.1 hypothetical protein [Paraliomyxa miuraensis]